MSVVQPVYLVPLPSDAQHVIVVGCGGNIGSPATRTLARLPHLTAMTLIDRDIYESKNLTAQQIEPADVGRPKAVVQAEVVRRINPALRVLAIIDAVENVPLGILRGSLIVACLDSRRARQYVNQAAWRLGVTWVDSGVRADGLLGRLNVYVPGIDQPCMECAFAAADYAALEQVYPCLGGAAEAAGATNAPAALGALAAAMQCIEVEKILAAQWTDVAVGRQVLISAAAHRHFVTTLRRNPGCRFDHATWSIDSIAYSPEHLTLGDLLAFVADADGNDRCAWALRVEPQVFVRRLVCARCGSAHDLGWRLSGRLGNDGTCERCLRPLLALETVDWLGDGAGVDSSTPLDRLGLRDGDVCSLRGECGERHVQLGAAPSARVPAASRAESPAQPGREASI